MDVWGRPGRRVRVELLWLLAVILLIKGILLLLDSHAAYFFGDSEGYLAVAVLKWIPPDRSFMYGLLLRRVAYHMHSLDAVIYLQVFCSALGAWLLSVALSRMLSTSFPVAATLAILCAVEPLQLLMERYVMTESVSNFLFAVQFVLILAYLKQGRLWTLLTSQAVGILLIGMRISFLPEVLINSVLVPLLSPNALQVYRSAVAKFRGKKFTLNVLIHRRAAAHFVLALLVSQGLLSAYEHWYGALKQREPALFYENGAFLIADLAPLVDLQDFPKWSRREAVFRRVWINRKDPQYRPAHHFLDGGLWHAVQSEYPDPKEANNVAAKAATHALLRQPFGAVRLAAQTFLAYFNRDSTEKLLLLDEGHNGRFSPTSEDWLRTRFGIREPKAYELTLTKRWHVFALPWYWLILCALAVSPLFLFLGSRTNWPLLIVAVLTALVFLEGATLTVDRPTPRFLTTDAWLVLLLFGVGADALMKRATQTQVMDPQASPVAAQVLPE